MSKRYAREIDLSGKNSAHAKMIEMVGEKKRVLDFGCFTGAVARVLKGKGCYVVGIEIDREAAEQAKKACDRVIVADLDGIDLREALGEERFDVCLFGDVLEHLKNPGMILLQARKVLDPGGYVVVSVPNIAHASVRLSLLMGEFEYEDVGILDDSHLRHFTRKSITDLLESCGFIIDAIDWTEKRIPEEMLRKTLDPLNLGNLEEVIKALSSWEAVAYQFIVKAYISNEEAQVRRISEEKVRAERRARELEEELEEAKRVIGDLKTKVEYFEEVEKKLAEQTSSFTSQLDKASRYAKELEKMIEEKDSYISILDNALRAKEEELARLRGEAEELRERLKSTQNELSRGKFRLFKRD